MSAGTTETPQLTHYTLPSSLRINVASWAGPQQGSGRPLVLLHGIWDTWRTFEGVAGRLSAERSVYALDLRGHGASDKPEEGYRHADYATDVLGVIEQLGFERVDLLGFSLGSLVAGQLIAAAPGRVARLVLEDPPVSPGADPRARAAWLATLLELKRLPFEEVVEGLAELNPTRDRATNELSARVLIATADGPFRALLAAQADAPELPAQLGRAALPTLILRADPAYGGALTEAGRAALLAACPAARVVEFPGSGHLVHAERADGFVAAVEGFLQEEAG